MIIRVRLFAAARDAFGFESRDLELSEPSLRAVQEALLAGRPAAARLLKACRFAVNRHYVGDVQDLAEGDEVAVIPPVSGG